MVGLLHSDLAPCRGQKLSGVRLGSGMSAVAWRVARVSKSITSLRALISAGMVEGLPDSRRTASAVPVIWG